MNSALCTPATIFVNDRLLATGFTDWAEGMSTATFWLTSRTYGIKAPDTEGWLRVYGTGVVSFQITHLKPFPAENSVEGWQFEVIPP